MSDGRRAIFVCTDVGLNPELIIYAYGLRFKIEVMFKSILNAVSGFAYHFWLSNFPKFSRKNGDFILHKAPEELRLAIARKMRAYEAFVATAAIAIGVLQLLALRYAPQIWEAYPLYIRTRSAKHQLPSENIVRQVLRGQVRQMLKNYCPAFMLYHFLCRKSHPPEQPHPTQFVPLSRAA